MFLLDAHVKSELRRPDKAGRNVAAWANSVAALPDESQAE